MISATCETRTVHRTSVPFTVLRKSSWSTKTIIWTNLSSIKGLKERVKLILYLVLTTLKHSSMSITCCRSSKGSTRVSTLQKILCQEWVLNMRLEKPSSSLALPIELHSGNSNLGNTFKMSQIFLIVLMTLMIKLVKWLAHEPSEISEAQLLL